MGKSLLPVSETWSHWSIKPKSKHRVFKKTSIAFSIQKKQNPISQQKYKYI